jgi:putative transposase
MVQVTVILIADLHERDEHGRKNLCCCTDGNLMMWAHLSPAMDRGGPVHRVEQVMRVNGWAGFTWAMKVRTTVSDPGASCPTDLVDRQLRVDAPNRLFVAVLVIDACRSPAVIVGWEVSCSKESVFVDWP